MKNSEDRGPQCPFCCLFIVSQDRFFGRLLVLIQDRARVFDIARVVPVLKKVQADQSTIEAVTGLVSPQAANIERLGFAVLGIVIKALDDAGTAAGANGLNVSLDAQLVADIKAIAAAVKGAVSVSAA